MTPGPRHKVTLYFLDWNGCTLPPPLNEKVEIYDAVHNLRLDSQAVHSGSNFCSGIYLSWLIAGHVRIRFTPTIYSRTAVLNGLFFDRCDAVSSPAQPRVRAASNTNLLSTGGLQP